jgi:hypothetical protein
VETVRHRCCDISVSEEDGGSYSHRSRNKAKPTTGLGRKTNPKYAVVEEGQKSPMRVPIGYLSACRWLPMLWLLAVFLGQ